MITLMIITQAMLRDMIMGLNYELAIQEEMLSAYHYGT